MTEEEQIAENIRLKKEALQQNSPELPAAEPPPTDPPIPPALEENPSEEPKEPPVKNLEELFTSPAPNDPATPAATPELSEEIKADLALAAEYKALLQKAKDGDPIVQAILYGMPPDKMIEWAQEIVPENYSNYSYEQLLKLDFKSKGLEGEELEDAVRDKVDEYNGFEKNYQRKTAENELRAKFKPTAKESNFLTAYRKQYEEAQANAPKPLTKEQFAEIQAKDLADIDKAMEAFEGGEMYGVKFDKDQIRKAYHTQHLAPFVKKDNSLDAKNFISETFYSLNRKSLLENAYEQGKKDALKGATFPNKNKGTTPAAASQNKTKEEQIAEALAASAGMDINKYRK